MLALPDRLDRAAHHLGPVSADVQAKRQNPRHHRRQPQVKADRLPGDRQREIQPEQLYQQRCAAKHLDIGDGQPAQQQIGRQFPDPGRKGKQRPEKRGIHRQLNGDPGPFQQGEKVFSPVHARSCINLRRKSGRHRGARPSTCQPFKRGSGAAKV